MKSIEDHIKETYEYDPATGKIFWKAKLKGKETFKTTMPSGYLFGKVLRKTFYAHRVAWLLHYGEWPKRGVDHINGVKTDNRLCNLRDVDQSENMKNRKIPKTNRSGVSGVWQEGSRWRATIVVNRQKHHLGFFDKFEQAVFAKKQAEAAYGFHKNHGRR